MSSLLRQAVASLEKDLKNLEEEEKLESGGVKEDAKKAKVRPTIVKGKKKKKTPKRAGKTDKQKNATDVKSNYDKFVALYGKKNYLHENLDNLKSLSFIQEVTQALNEKATAFRIAELDKKDSRKRAAESKAREVRKKLSLKRLAVFSDEDFQAFERDLEDLF